MKHFLLLLFVSVLIFTGCSDETGDMPADILGKRISGEFFDSTVVFTSQDLNIVSTRNDYNKYNGLWLGNLNSKEYGFTIFFNADTTASDISFATITLFYDEVYSENVPEILDFKVDFTSSITNHEDVFNIDGAYSAHRIYSDSLNVESGVDGVSESYFDSKSKIYRAVYMIPEELLDMLKKKNQIAISVLYENLEGLTCFYVPGFSLSFQPNVRPYIELTSTSVEETNRGEVLTSSVKRYRASNYQNYVPRAEIEQIDSYSMGNMDNNSISFTFPQDYDFKYNIKDVEIEFVPVFQSATYGFDKDNAKFNLKFALSTNSASWKDTLTTANITGWSITALRNNASISIEPSFNVPFLYDANIEDIKVTIKKSIYRE